MSSLECLIFAFLILASCHSSTVVKENQAPIKVLGSIPVLKKAIKTTTVNKILQDMIKDTQNLLYCPLPLRLFLVDIDFPILPTYSHTQGLKEISHRNIFALNRNIRYVINQNSRLNLFTPYHNRNID